MVAACCLAGVMLRSRVFHCWAASINAPVQEGSRRSSGREQAMQKLDELSDSLSKPF